MQLDDLYGKIGAVAAVVVGIVTLFKKFEPAAKLLAAAVSFIKAFIFGNIQVLERLTKIDSTLVEHGRALESLQRENRVNGGATIKDDLGVIRDGLLIIGARVDELTNVGNLAIYQCDKAGACDWVSDSLAEMFGMDRSDMTSENGFGWLRGVHHDDRSRVRGEWLRSVNEGYPFDYDFRLSDGKRVHSTARAVRDSTKAVRAYHGVVRLFKEERS